MQRYTKNYIKSLGLTLGDYFPCEACPATTVDVHHITPRSLGGSDEPENLIGLCRECHDKTDGGELTREYLYSIVRKRMGEQYREGCHLRKYAEGGEQMCFEEDVCHYCDGDGYITLDLDNVDDPVNFCDWKSGGEVGDVVKCTCCGGSGKIEDCTWT